MHDLIYTPETISIECYNCQTVFKLYTIQQMPMNFCHVCGVNNKLTELTTLSIVVKKIVEYAEKENQRINDRLVVDISNLIQNLQEATNE